jgi:hypothetical protein
MKWIVITLFVLAGLLFAIGKWTRMSGRSADERAGSDIPYLLGALLLTLNVCLLVAWAIMHLIF